MHEDASLTVHGNKSKFNHPRAVRAVKVMAKYHISVSGIGQRGFWQ